jgi:alanine racemase
MTWQAPSHPEFRRCWLDVDLGAISENTRSFRRLVGPSTSVIAVVKADGYGLGATAVSQAALAGGAARLAVANVQEAIELRQNGIASPIHVLGPLFRKEVEAVVEYDLIPSLYDEYSFHQLSKAAVRHGKNVTVHIKIDSGMGRHGWFPRQAESMAPGLARLPGIAIEGAFTHFAEAADKPYTLDQLENFDRTCEGLEEKGLLFSMRHSANTTAAVLFESSRYEAIRPGLGLLGICDDPRIQAKLPLKKALAWKTQVVQIKDYLAGQVIGYNRTYVVQRPTRGALLPIGYADGYRREFSNRADVLIRGTRCRVIGRVSMDCAIADVSFVSPIRVGDEVTLVGSDGLEHITVEELVGLIPNGVPHEVITSLGSRNQRHYRNYSHYSQVA